MRDSNQNLLASLNFLASLGEQLFVKLNGLKMSVQKHGRIATSPLASSC